jgi:uncharacterized membrane protein YfhO
MNQTAIRSLAKKIAGFDMNQYSSRKALLFVFILSFVLAVAFFLPYVIMDKGYFFYLGDYNCQQIPFNMMANEAVHEGNIFWNWNTDLGANFIGSYAFYLLGSPFFLIQLALPSSVIPMALPWVLCLKFAVSGVTSYLYLKRFVTNQNYALFAALMYAFSSFSVYSIFFNHFNDIIALFPLMMYGLEEFMENDRKGIFAFAVFINALCNYYFFVAEVIFLGIYFYMRLYHRAWPKFNFRKFLALAFESAAGFGMAAFIVLPAVLTTLQLPRAEARLDGWALITYYEIQRPYQILQAFFFPPEIPSQLNFFPNAGAKWSSVTAWLPMFGMVGAIAWMRKPRKDWLGRIIFTLILMAFIPTLNASFQLLSRSFYTRWFFVLVLMLALATAKTLQGCSLKQIKTGLLWTAGMSAAIALPVGLIKDPSTLKPLAAYPDRLWAYVGIVTVSLLLVYVLVFVLRRESRFFPIMTLISLCAVIVGYANFNIILGRGNRIPDPMAYVERNIRGREKFDLPDLRNIRIDVLNGEENSGMFWRIPTIHTFHSVVPGSIVEFYPTIGVERNVASRPKQEKVALRSFVSVKYLFEGKNEDSVEAFGFEKIDTQNGFGIWENKNYIPYGFTYDQYLSRAEFLEFSEFARDRILLKAIVLDPEEEKKYGHLFEKFNTTFLPDNSNAALEVDCANRRAESAHYFERDNLGFDAKITTSRETLVFFTVPYEPGWSATVNGEEAEIVKSNIGFMSVRVPEGDSVIRFNYMTPGLVEGLLIFAGSLLLLILYLFIWPRIARSEKYLLVRGNIKTSFDRKAAVWKPVLTKDRTLFGIGKTSQSHEKNLSDSTDLKDPKDPEEPRK